MYLRASVCHLLCCLSIRQIIRSGNLLNPLNIKLAEGGNISFRYTMAGDLEGGGVLEGVKPSIYSHKVELGFSIMDTKELKQLLLTTDSLGHQGSQKSSNGEGAKKTFDSLHNLSALGIPPLVPLAIHQFI